MRTRFTIQTSEELDSALEQIRIATNRSTKSEVIRDSLELYDLIVQHFITGERLYLGVARDSAAEVLLPHLERAANRLARPQLVSVPASEPRPTTRVTKHSEHAVPDNAASRPGRRQKAQSEKQPTVSSSVDRPR